jgi:hypothetical protein
VCLKKRSAHLGGKNMKAHAITKASNKLIFVFLTGGFSEEFAGLNFILIYILSFIGQKRAKDEISFALFILQFKKSIFKLVKII